MTFYSPPEETIQLYEDGFGEDLLERAKTSKMLSDVLDRIEDPLVIALDGKWGTGKSYFLQRWVGAHRSQNEGQALTIYFDAFAHDYQSDPLVALVSALTDRLPSEDDPKTKKLMAAAGKLIRPASRIGLALASYGAMEALNGLGDAAVAALKGEADKALNDYLSRERGRQSAMEEFHSAISSLTTTVGPADADAHTPLVIVVDELDRCRPDYALEVLEIIKHFFAVPHVHFVLGVNLTALENSVRMRYGAGIDASAYLQKFISFSMSLPEHLNGHPKTPNIIAYANHFGRRMGVPKELQQEINSQLKILSRNNDVSIRHVGKILSATALLPDEARNDRMFSSWRKTLVSLLIARVIRPDIFKKLVNASISADEIGEFLCVTNGETSRDRPDGRRNEVFDRDVYILLNTWLYLSTGGHIEEETTRAMIAKSFDHWSERTNPAEIPRQIYDDWLSVFNLP